MGWCETEIERQREKGHKKQRKKRDGHRAKKGRVSEAQHGSWLGLEVFNASVKLLLATPTTATRRKVMVGGDQGGGAAKKQKKVTQRGKKKRG